jgi:hypothetical protein
MAQLRARHAEDAQSLRDAVDQLTAECTDLAEKLLQQQEKPPMEIASSALVDGSDICFDQSKVRELQDKLTKSELIRKKLQNTVHELRGNVRVFVRCRPLLRGDEEYGQADALAGTAAATAATAAVQCCEEANVISLPGAGPGAGAGSRGGGGGGQTFSFDQVFRDSSSQDQVFGAVSDLIQSALDGYRVCVFCYGQTGSGEWEMTSSDRLAAISVSISVKRR